MKLGIISDIHSNLEALQAVHQKFISEKVEQIICLGDVVGYGPNPSSCVDWVRKYCWDGDKVLCLKGNHDLAVGIGKIENFNPIAIQAVTINTSALDAEKRYWLSKLPLSQKINEAAFFHSSPLQPRRFRYIVSLEDAEKAMDSFKGSLIFVGHSHVPSIAEMKMGISRFVPENHITISPDTKYLINVGSVGQPRDGDPRAACGILDFNTNEYQLFRVEYDIQKTQEKIFLLGLPEILATRLSKGY